jgi:hypothetical protein
VGWRIIGLRPKFHFTLRLLATNINVHYSIKLVSVSRRSAAHEAKNIIKANNTLEF